MDAPLLEVTGLRTSFTTPRGKVQSVDDVSFAIPRGQTLGLVGESGSGKSVTSLSVMRLVGRGGGSVDAGRIVLRARDGAEVDVLALPEARMRDLRGRDMAMIFQEPMTSLDPVWSIGVMRAAPICMH